MLVKHFIEKHDEGRKVDPSLEPIQGTPDCMALLMKHHWKDGNARELENVISDIMLDRYYERRDIIPSDLPAHIIRKTTTDENPTKAKKALPGNQKITIEDVARSLQQNNSNKSAAAKELGISVRHLRRICNTHANNSLISQPNQAPSHLAMT